MTKLTELLAKQEALTEEFEGVSSFINLVYGQGTLVMSVVPVGEEEPVSIKFTPEDIGIELEVLAPIRNRHEALALELKAVNDKVAALEVLMD